MDSGLEALILLTKKSSESQIGLLKDISASMEKDKNVDVVSAIEALIVTTEKKDEKIMEALSSLAQKKSDVDIKPIAAAVAEETKKVISSIDELKKKYKERLDDINKKTGKNKKAIAELRAEILKDLQAVARERFSAPAVQNFIKQFSFEDVDPEEVRNKLMELEGNDRLDAQYIKGIEEYIPEPQVYRGPTTFAGLTDTPTNLVAGKWFKVNAEGTAIEFVDEPAGGGGSTWGSITGTLGDQTDLQNALDDKLESGDNISELANDSGFTDYEPSGLTDNRMLRANGTDDVQNTGYTVDDNDVMDTAAGQIHSTEQTLTDGASIAWDLTGNQVAVVTLGGNRTLANPTNMKSGGTYILTVKQDATGSRTLAYGTAYKWSGGTAPTLTTTANAVDIITFISDGTNMYGTIITDFQ